MKMKKMKINGESGDVRGKTVNSWKEKIPELLQEDSSENIWKLDETGSFGGLYHFGKRGLQHKGGIKSKTVGDNCLNCKCR